MEYRSLGRTGAQVSCLCFGAMNFGDGTDDAQALSIVEYLLHVGVNFIDTANVYSRGKSEEMLGEILAYGGRRDKVFLATKAHHRMGDGPNDYGNSRLHLIKACEDSLRRLKTDHIDLYQIHRPQPAVPIDETLAALDSLVNAGKVCYIGTSTFAAWQVVEALWTSRNLNLVRFVCDQPPYNLLDRRIERELVPMAATYGIGIIPWAPLAGGLLSGKYSRESAPPEGSRYTNDRFRGAPITEPIWNLLDKLTEIASEKECTLSQLCLAWCLRQPSITAPIIGARTLEQVQDNLKALDVSITDDDRKRIDALAPPGTHLKDYYSASFGPNARV